VASPYLTPDQIRARVAVLTDVDRYPDDEIAEVVAEFEGLVEDYRGVAFTTRTATETYDIPAAGGREITLAWPKVQAVTSVAIDGSTVDPTLYWLGEAGTIHAIGSPITGTAVTVTYTHGFTTTPQSILRATREYVRAVLLQNRSNVPRDVIGRTGPDGGPTERYSTPDPSKGRLTGYLEVDRLVTASPNYRRRIGVG
jgi:hypothetical protein